MVRGEKIRIVFYNFLGNRDISNLDFFLPIIIFLLSKSGYKIIFKN